MQVRFVARSLTHAPLHCIHTAHGSSEAFREVSVWWRRCCHPFKRIRLPRVIRCLLSKEPALDDVRKEHKLEKNHNNQRRGRQNTDVLEIRSCQLREVLEVVDSTVLTGYPDKKEGDEDKVQGYNRAPEVYLAQCFVQHLSKHFREPIRDARKRPNKCNREECVVEVRDDKIRIVQIDIGTTRSKEDSCNTTDDKLGNEGQCPEHRCRERY